MAFTAGIKKPQQSGNSYGQQSTFDRLVVVTGYDLNEHVMHAEDVRDGKKYKVFVNPEEVLKTDAAISAKGTDVSKINWMGHKIDAGMQKNIKVGHRCTLVRSKVVGTDKTTGITDLEIHRVSALPSQKADKSFQGIISMTYRMEDGAEKVGRIFHWNPNGVGFDLENLSGLEALAAKIDEAGKDFGVKKGDATVTKPTIGIQFRTLMKTDKTYPYAKDGEPKEVYEVVDVSQPFDWIPGKTDEDGKEIKSAAHPITGDEMIGFAESYFQYVTEDNENFKDMVADLKFEVCFYHSYPATKSDALQLTTGNKDKDKNADKNPLYQLCHRKAYGDLENSNDGLIVGKNAAVNGIVALSDDKLIEIDDQPVKVPSYWVNKVFANNIRGHVHAFVRTSEGAKCEPHEKLMLVKSENLTNTASNARAPQAQQEVPTSRPLAAPQAPEVAEEGFDPFSGNDSDVSTPAPRVGFGTKKM